MPVAPAPSTRAPSPEGGHRFAAALQSALTLSDVEDAFFEVANAVIPAPGCGLYRIDADSGSMIDFKAQVENDFLTDYETYGRQDDPVLEFVLRQNRPVDSSRVVSRQTWEGCGARTALDIGGYYHSLEAPVIVSGVLYGTMNFARPEGQPAFSDADLTAARLAGEQLGLATERALRYEETGRRGTRLEHVLDHVPQALVVTDLDAHVLFRNRAARTGDHSASTTALVEDSIVEAMEEFRALGKRVYTRTAVDRHTRRRVVVKSFRLPDRDDAALTLLFEQVPEDAVRLPAWDVLSKREQEIAELVSQGLTNKQIAERAFVSENTVKQHLKRVFAKTDVRNRAELMQRIWAAGGARPADS
ncbi:LuxR C-terminal-related transcriptional regulator [Amycolatopsis sp. NPDC005232]|uniref:LuxR C-terminal-related transcriptional regulator n=1 Tax=Amycolatopsis sp. NPDC005232 TaxID=3157027 RepID=UPI0033B080F5